MNRQADFAGFTLTALRSLSRGIDTVVDRIAQHVLQRGLYLLEYTDIQATIVTVDFKLHLFIELATHLVYQAPKAWSKLGETHQAQQA